MKRPLAWKTIHPVDLEHLQGRLLTRRGHSEVDGSLGQLRPRNETNLDKLRLLMN